MSIADNEPHTRSVTIIAADGDTLPSMIRAVQAARARVVDRGLIDEPDWTFRSIGDVVMVDVRDMDASAAAVALEAITARLSDNVELLVRTTLAELDAVLASCPDAAEILVSADDLELHLALAAALMRSGGAKSRWHDVASEEGLRLQRLADEIGRIARTLIDLPEGLGSGGALSDGSRSYRPQPDDTVDAEATAPAITAAEVRMIIRMRRLRDRFFAPDLFADPAWDMLLDLAAARIERTHVAVSSLCIAAAVPPTTALRWIKAMTDRGLLRRVADAHDARRVFIQLSDEAAKAMDHYLRTARTAHGLAI